MSLTDEYKELDKIRKEDGKKSLEHYKSVDLPGKRTKGVNADDVRKRIAEMKAEREKSK